MTKIVLLMTIIFTALPQITYAARVPRCSSLFPTSVRQGPSVRHDPSLTKIEQMNGMYHIDGVPVTSNQYNFSMALQDLGFQEPSFSEGRGRVTRGDLQLANPIPRHKTILSVGEGANNLIKNLSEMYYNQGIGLDTWYERPDLPSDLANFVTRNRNYLVTGEATDLPFSNNQFDLVVAHAVLFYLSSRDQGKAIEEMLRVTRPGGEVRIASVCPTGTECGVVNVPSKFSRIAQYRTIESEWAWAGRTVYATARLIILSKPRR